MIEYTYYNKYIENETFQNHRMPRVSYRRSSWRPYSSQEKNKGGVKEYRLETAGRVYDEGPLYHQKYLFVSFRTCCNYFSVFCDNRSRSAFHCTGIVEAIKTNNAQQLN